MGECARRCASLSVYFWHSEGWTPRNEALMEAVDKQVRTTRHPWLIACDANMCPEDFKKSPWFRSRHMFTKAPGEGVSTCRSKGPNGEFFERTYDCVIASHSLQGETNNMEVVADFESRPHKAVTFLEERDKEFQVWREQKMPKGSARIQRWKAARKKQGGRRKRRRGRREERQGDNEVIRRTIAGVPKDADTVGGGVTRNAPEYKCWRGFFQEIGARSWAEG